jgi:hypothetical protein
MAEEPTRKFDLPWGTMLPVLAALAGIFAQFKPLVSTRPPVPNEKPVPVIAEQDVNARLWQDPIAVAQKQEASLDAETKAGRVPENASSRYELSALGRLLRERADKFQVLLLGVMLDAGPYSEQGESRLRARQAVLEGLSESGFVPIDGEHIGFVTAEWPPDSLSAPPPKVPSPTIKRVVPDARNTGAVGGTTLVLPWEECEATGDPKKVFPPDTTRVFVVWLPAANFNPSPLRYFAGLINRLAPTSVRQKIQVRLIGPANSTGLQNMVREVRWDRDRLSAVAKEALNGVSIISPRATVSDLTLLSSPSSAAEAVEWAAEAAEPSTDKTVETLLERKVAGLNFVRTIAPDDWVLHELIAELTRRRIDIVSQMTPDRRPVPPKLSHIVILSEWDTPYGRSLAATFESQASGRTVKEIIEEPEKRPPWIHSYHYLRGIDGQLPGDSGKDNQRESAQKTQVGKDTVAIEATEGLNQSDYLRRLARQMKEDNARWRREDNSGIRAIGLLGSDIYDKLMILRALRPQFPEAVFFTNNYDAHFERRDDWDDTHNLVIVSPFGSTLPEIYIQQHIAPFRDTNQTSMYVGTLVATGRMKEPEARCLSWQPRIFEIGRHGAYDLSQPWYLWHEGDANIVYESHYDRNEKTKPWFRDWLFTAGVIPRLIIVALTVLAIAAWISISIARRTLLGGGTARERLQRAFVNTTFWLVCGGPLIIFLVALVAQYCAPQEPLAFFSGISIWPSEMLRLVAFMLAIFFMAKAGFVLRANAREIEKDFSFAELPLTRFRSRDLGIGFEHWQMKEPARTSRFSAEDAWHAYLCRNKFWPRFIRIGILFTMYSVFAFTLYRLFPKPMPPARGEMAFVIDDVVNALATVGLLLLFFYVVDAIQLNSNFIRMFGREVTKWGRSVVDRSHRHPPLTEKELSAYHEIFFVAQRTQVVAPLIWYPLIVLSLMIVARSSFFDNWAWPASLVLIFAITAAWALGSAILLRRAAEQLRQTALNDLRRFRLLGQESEAKRHTFDELIAEIRDLKTGAFAPLTEQPFIRAIILPSGGLGLLAVGQRLLDLF